MKSVGFLIGVLLFLYGSVSRAAEIKVYGHESMPFCGTVDGQPAGMAVDILNAVTALGGPSFEFEFSPPWARAQKEMLDQPGALVAIVPLTRTPERESTYKWIAELFTHNARLISVGRPAPFKSIDEAKHMAVGNVRGSAQEATLKKLGFTNIEFVPNDEINAKKIRLGRIQAWVVSEYIDKFMYSKIGEDPAKLQVGPTVGERSHIYIAGGLTFPEAHAKAIADAMKRLRASGKVELILQKYRRQARGTSDVAKDVALPSSASWPGERPPPLATRQRRGARETPQAVE
jgi:polar amino acid transport system substrate-binding protein